MGCHTSSIAKQPALLQVVRIQLTLSSTSRLRHLIPRTPRSTEHSVPEGAAVIRLARILCPSPVRPLRLARRPGWHAGITALKASFTGVGNKESGSVDQAVPLGEVCFAARPIVDRLTNPSDLLSRPSGMPPVDELIKSVAKRKGITLSTKDLTTIVLGVTDGSAPPAGIKRVRPSATSVLPRDNSVNAVDLVNGILASGAVNGEASSPSSSTALGAVGSEGDTSPPPRKKQLLGGSSL
ncbi:hypothetical protein FGIG_08894 [Fasciola gigantica]|uniref:Uncharacterized protein n=1 Tax=Fasciola gigantica TaxID=46835 RepID=A0A504YJT4_FASGI|nr:hypothetical protein FGIG_08894 [Fasciola gigantica]